MPGYLIASLNEVKKVLNKPLAGNTESTCRWRVKAGVEISDLKEMHYQETGRINPLRHPTAIISWRVMYEHASQLAELKRCWPGRMFAIGQGIAAAKKFHALRDLKHPALRAMPAAGIKRKCAGLTLQGKHCRNEVVGQHHKCYLHR